MKKILVVYHSATGNTEKMARLVAEGAAGEGRTVECRKALEVTPEMLLGADAVVVGSPTYYGTMAWQVKEMLDKSITMHGKLEGRVGAAFASSANIGGGNETTITDILHALLIHGMIVQGDSQGGHYGVVSIGRPDARVEKECRRLGERVAGLVMSIAPGK